jgi:aminoglycoside phosphotransferase (APT) family kinase protein
VSVPGIGDVAGLARWLAAHGLCGEGVLPRVELIPGGRSNLTYRLDFPSPRHGGDADEPAGTGESGGAGAVSGPRGAVSGPRGAVSGPRATAGGPRGTAGELPGTRLVLRRPPLGHVLPTAHDMGREYRVLTALAGGAVPVPRPLAFCPDGSVIGAPFYVMAWVEGTVLRAPADAAALRPGQAAELSRLFVETLAAIHGVDVAAAGLSGFGRPEGYLARQLARWQRQWELSATREVPGYRELAGRLAARLPASGDGTLVHGDFRIDNMVLRLAGQVRVEAVLDWEMSTLGDPLADLGLALVYWTDPGEPNVLGPTGDGGVTGQPGFWTRTQLAEHYALITGRDLSQLGYYMAFGCFKLAVVLEGIHARYLKRQTVGEGFGRQGSVVPVLIERAHRLLAGRL